MSRAPVAGVKTLWLTGLSGAGKTTIAEAFARRLTVEGVACTVLDGDALRKGLNAPLGFSQPERSENIRRAAEVARLFNEAGVWVVAALISPRAADREQVRQIVGHGRCRMVWVRASLEVCEARDPKGLYVKARAGQLPGFTGIDAPYDEPCDADSVVDSAGASVDACVEMLWTQHWLQTPVGSEQADESNASSKRQIQAFPTSGVLPFDGALELWLRRAVTQGSYTAADIAAAMTEDGYPADVAHVLAASAWVRYGGAPLEAIFMGPEQRLNGHQLRRHLGSYLFGKQGASGAGDRSCACWDPTRHAGNVIVLKDRTIELIAVAEHPRLAILGNVLSDDECEAVILAARSKLELDKVVLPESGDAVVDSTARSSMGCGLARSEFELLARLEARVSELLQCAHDRFENVAVSCYRTGAQFGFHHDYFRKSTGGGETGRYGGTAGDRIATLVIYLNDVDGEGATVFPEIGLHVRPRRGNAVFFSYLCPDGSPDPASEHSGGSVSAGEKWIATFWLREKSGQTGDVPSA